MNLKLFCTPIIAAVALLGTTGTSMADRKFTVRRDLDGDGHYNKKTYSTHDRGYGRGYSGRGYYGSRGYYGGSGYRYGGYPYGGYGYGYRPFGYGYGYGYPRTSIGVSLFSRPTYSTSRVYRSYSTGDSLATDVQSALRRQGYYRGSIDGSIGPASRSAIRAYQRDRGLSVTGRIDSQLLRSLRVG